MGFCGVRTSAAEAAFLRVDDRHEWTRALPDLGVPTMRENSLRRLGHGMKMQGSPSAPLRAGFRLRLRIREANPRAALRRTRIAEQGSRGLKPTFIGTLYAALKRRSSTASSSFEVVARAKSRSRSTAADRSVRSTLAASSSATLSLALRLRSEWHEESEWRPQRLTRGSKSPPCLSKGRRDKGRGTRVSTFVDFTGMDLCGKVE